MRDLCYGFVFIVVFMCLVACQSPPAPTAQPTATSVEGKSLSFEAVALNESGANIDVHSIKDETQLLLLTSTEDAALIQDQVNRKTWQQLQAVNFDEYVVIALLRGRQPSSNYQAIIEGIVQQKDQLLVYAQFWEPNSAWESTAEETSPYHLVKVGRQDIMDLPQVKLTLQTNPITPTPPAN